MGKYEKLTITGEVRKELDAQAMSRVILLLARQMLKARTADKRASEESNTPPHMEPSP